MENSLIYKDASGNLIVKIDPDGTVDTGENDDVNTKEFWKVIIGEMYRRIVELEIKVQNLQSSLE